MKNDIKSPVITKTIFTFFGVSLALFIANVAVNILPYSVTVRTIIFCLLRLLPYIVLGVSCAAVNKYNARRIVFINVMLLMISYAVGVFTNFMPLYAGSIDFYSVPNFVIFGISALIALFVLLYIPTSSGDSVFVFSVIMSILAIVRMIQLCDTFGEFNVGAILLQLSYMFYYFPLAIMSEYFADENIYTSRFEEYLSKFGKKDADEEKKRASYSKTFDLLALYHISTDRKDGDLYKQFYKEIRKGDYSRLDQLGDKKKDFLLDFCKAVKEFCEISTRKTDEDIILENCVNYVLKEDLDDETFEAAVFNLLTLFRHGYAAENKCSSYIDIKYGSDDPKATALSNFSEHPFVFDGVKCKSMESFLQSLKFKNPEKQMEVCQMDGKSAKKVGSRHNFWKYSGGNLYWQGKYINRFSKDYDDFIDTAYVALFEGNKDFVDALMSTVDENGMKLLFEHTVGKDMYEDTILTDYEFIDRLYQLREIQINQLQEV